MIIWLASYPRSGNTFLRVILNNVFGLETYSIYDDKTGIGKDAATSKIVGHRMLPDDFDISAAETSEKLYLIKTHCEVPPETGKVIYLVRDGRESSVSYMNYIRSYNDPNCALEDVIYGNVRFGTWGQHLENWSPATRKDTLLLKFEELVSNPDSFLADLAEFIGVEGTSQEIPSFKELQQINPKFFRKGQTDSWKQAMDQYQLLAFWASSFDQMTEYYAPKDSPSLVRDPDVATKMQEIVVRQRTYFLSSLERRKQKHKEREAGLQNDLKRANRGLNRIKRAMDNLTQTQFFKSPLKKYRAYKSLCELFYSNEK